MFATHVVSSRSWESSAEELASLVPPPTSHIATACEENPCRTHASVRVTLRLGTVYTYIELVLVLMPVWVLEHSSS